MEGFGILCQMEHLSEMHTNYGQLLEKIDVPLITRIIPIAKMKEVVSDCNVQEKRVRRLPAWLMVLLCIMRGIFATEAFGSVFARLCFVPCILANFSIAKLPDKSALCLARYRLGVAPMLALFRSVCRPLATEETPRAFLYGYRLVAIDSTFENVSDTPVNAAYFGRHRNGKGRSDAAYPSFQALYLSECSTHVIFDAIIAPFRTNHHQYFKRLLRSIDDQMLLMFDRGLQSYDGFKAIKEKKAQFLTPAKQSAKLTPIQYLADGSYTAHIKSWANKGANNDEPIEVRVIAYTIEDHIRNPKKLTYRLITSLMDAELHQAEILIEIYHQRWEIEIAIDEIDSHQRLTWTPFRSQKPLGIIQEFYSLLLAYYIICALRFESASFIELAPQRLSFINTLRLIQHTSPISQLIWKTHQQQLLSLMYQWQDYFRLPDRENRQNPRVVKRKRNKFRRKSAADKSIVVLPFTEVIRVIRA
jgi:hypothetical protein